MQELAQSSRLVEELSAALSQREIESAEASRGAERARMALEEKEARQARVAAAVQRAHEQTAALEALCVRTERASGEQIMSLQRELRAVRGRCEALGAALAEERDALRSIAGKAEALAQREQVALGAHSEAAAEASATAQQLLAVQVRWTPGAAAVVVLPAVGAVWCRQALLHRWLYGRTEHSLNMLCNGLKLAAVRPILVATERDAVLCAEKVCGVPAAGGGAALC